MSRSFLFLSIGDLKRLLDVSWRPSYDVNWHANYGILCQENVTIILIFQYSAQNAETIKLINCHHHQFIFKWCHRMRIVDVIWRLILVTIYCGRTYFHCERYVGRKFSIPNFSPTKMLANTPYCYPKKFSYLSI